MWGRRCFLFLLFVFAWVVPAFAQVDTAWVRRYNGPGNDLDVATAIAVDTFGNVYVTGKSIGGGSAEDYVTIKYNSSGNELWVKRYNGPGNGQDEASALAIDVAGNIYVTGRSPGSGGDDDFATIKYRPNGDTAWVRRYSGPGNDADVATAIAVDVLGNIYVTGKSIGSGSAEDYAILKYDSSGNELWVKRYNGPANSFDAAYAIAVGGFRYIYITGESEGSGTSRDFATIKYVPGFQGADTLRIIGASASPCDNAVVVSVYLHNVEPIAGFQLRVVYDQTYLEANSQQFVNPTPSHRAYPFFNPNNGAIYAADISVPGEVTFVAVRLFTPVQIDPGAGSIVDLLFNVKRTAPEGSTLIRLVDSPDSININALSDLSGNLILPVLVDDTFFIGGYCDAKSGDADASCSYTLADIIATVNYIFNKPGCSTQPLCWLSDLLCRGDWNGDASVSLTDVIRGVNYIFSKPGGPWNPLPSGACCLLP